MREKGCIYITCFKEGTLNAKDECNGQCPEVYNAFLGLCLTFTLNNCTKKIPQEANKDTCLQLKLNYVFHVYMQFLEI